MSLKNDLNNVPGIQSGDFSYVNISRTYSMHSQSNRCLGTKHVND